MAIETIVTIITIGLALMLVLAFSIHTIERNKREKRQMESMLRKKLSDLLYMLNHFPVNFLGTDLQVLICKSVLDVYEQLIDVDPKNREYSNNRRAITERLQNLQSQNKEQGYQPLDNLAQIKEIKGMLGLLGGFITRLYNQKVLTPEQASHYSNQLKKLLAQTTVDSYVVGARDAEGSGKLKLAIHYYTSAVQKLKKEGLDSLYHEHILRFDRRVEELQLLVEKNPEAAESSLAIASEKLEEDDPWKKKQAWD